ncbi:hypothetical protein [Pelistega indica]|uniref:hypothetical protein n=1 Tax=Pelistega indica TaxID=1414851 RepID=UPI001C48735B|nr:hypothetical protein [Pelistega indica]
MMKFTKISYLFTLLLMTGTTMITHASPSIADNPLKNQPFANQTATSFSLDFDASKFVSQTTEVDGQPLHYRAIEKIVYVKNPVEADYQTL